MHFSIVDSILQIKLNAIAVLFVASIMMLIGIKIKHYVTVLERLCIPTPVVAGLPLAFICFVLKMSGVATITMDTAYQAPFMLVFFATVGLGASFGILKQGGKDFVKYLLLGMVVATYQNFLAVGLAFATDISPMHGIMMGAATMVGGHGGAAAFGAELDAMGYAGSTAVGMASATFGVVAGSLVGGPVARKLINKYNLTSAETHAEPLPVAYAAREHKPLSIKTMFQILSCVFFAVTFGSMVCNFITRDLGIIFPSTVGAMIFGTAIRNLNDKYHFLDLDSERVDTLSDACLNIFLTMSIMSLALDQLVAMAVPMMIILLSQVVALALFAYFVVFPALGRNYDAAAMCAGLLGHGLGATPNAVANIGALAERYGPSRKALLICSITGAFALDLYQLPLDSLFISYFK